MKLTSATFSFIKGFVTWTQSGDNAPTYDGNSPKFVGKKYPWVVVARYDGYEASWHAFGSPTPGRSKRYLQSVKKTINEQKNKNF